MSRPGTVMIAEESGPWPHVDVVDYARRGVDYSTLDPGDVFCWTGQFSAHWESDEHGYREGPSDLSADDAIAWGRSQADVVFIRVGNGDLGGDEGYFSAGTQHPDDDVPVWQEGMPVPVRPIRASWRRAGVGHYDLLF